MAEQFTIPFVHKPDLSGEALIPHAGLSAAREWLAAYPNWPTPALILHGPPASGKSHVSAGFNGPILDLSDQPLTHQRAEDLFHLLNRLKAEGGHILILAPVFPGQIYPNLPDLDSRLRASSAVGLTDPKEDAVRQAIFFKLCTDHQMRVEMETAAYVCTRLPQTNAALDLFCHRAGQELRQETLTKPAARRVIEALEAELEALEA